MQKQNKPTEFNCVLAPFINKFLIQKRSLGYHYTREALALCNFDRFLVALAHSKANLPRTVVEQWTEKRGEERPRSQGNRISLMRQLGKSLVRQGIEAHIPDTRLAPIVKLDFTPRIFTTGEVGRILRAVEQMPISKISLRRHIIMPHIFHLLYGCGLRVGEVCHLQIRDMDSAEGILTVRKGKFHKDRLVPMAQSLAKRVRQYAATYMASAAPEDILFPAPDAGPYCHTAVYSCPYQKSHLT